MSRTFDDAIREHQQRTAELEHWFAKCEEQDQTNARLKAEQFTGAAYDHSVFDWAAWMDGQRIGWYSTPTQADQAIYDARCREIKRAA